MHNANVVRLPTIEICIDDGCAEIGRCWLTTRYALTANQIQRVCRAYARQLEGSRVSSLELVLALHRGATLAFGGSLIQHETGFHLGTGFFLTEFFYTHFFIDGRRRNQASSSLAKRRCRALQFATQKIWRNRCY